MRTELIVFADFLSKKIFVHFLPTILRCRIIEYRYKSYNVWLF